tara:strand:- start:166 stop:522 length:357 start_codon:yes stop_codon:yes gene_type:complete
MSCATVQVLCKHKDDVEAFYSDWSEVLIDGGATLVSAVVTFEDTALTIGSVTVVAADITLPNSITVTALKAFQFNLTGGTSLGLTEADVTTDPVLGNIAATFSDGKVKNAQLLLKVYG